MINLILLAVISQGCPSCNVSNYYYTPSYQVASKPKYYVLDYTGPIEEYTRFVSQARTPSGILIKVPIINGVMPAIISERVEGNRNKVYLDYTKGQFYTERYDGMIIRYNTYGRVGNANYNECVWKVKFDILDESQKPILLNPTDQLNPPGQ